MDERNPAAVILPCVEIDPPDAHRSSVVWLHGLGADGHDFEPIVPELRLPEELAVRFVFPHAPRIPVSVNMGFVMPAWYDIRGADLRSRHDEAGIRRSAGQIVALVEREHEKGVPYERIMLAGFSQGGAIALHVGLCFPHRLAGIIGLSTYLVLHETLAAEAHAANRGTSILLAHGTFDPMVPHARGVESRERLEAAGYDVTWHEYPMQHQVCLEEIQEVAVFLVERLSVTDS